MGVLERSPAVRGKPQKDIVRVEPRYLSQATKLKHPDKTCHLVGVFGITAF